MVIYDEKKAQKLRLERGIDLAEIVQLVLDGNIIDLLDHPVRKNQQLFIVSYKNYVHVVPFIIGKNESIIIKTAYPSRKFNQIYSRGKK